MCGVSERYLNVYGEKDLRAQMNQFFHRTYTHPVDGTTLDMKMLCNWYWYDETAILETGKNLRKTGTSIVMLKHYYLPLKLSLSLVG